MSSFSLLSLLAAVMLFGAFITGLSIGNRGARRFASSFGLACTGVLGFAFLLQFPLAPTGGEMKVLPWLSPLLVAFTVLAAGTVNLALSPLHGSSPRSFAGLMALIAIALLIIANPGMPVTVGLVIAALTALSIGLWDARETREAAAFGAITVAVPSLFVLGADALGHHSDVLLALWLLVLIGAPPFHGWALKLAKTLTPAHFAGTLILNAAVFQAVLGDFSQRAQPLLATLFALSALFAAALSCAQLSARRALAAVAISQFSMAGFAAFSGSPTAATGATWLILGVLTTTLGAFLLLGALEARRGEAATLGAPEGCYDSWPRLANGFLVLGLASAGLPLTLGFVASDMILEGGFGVLPFVTLLVLLAGALNALTLMRMFLYLFQGRRGEAQPSDLRPRELRITFGLMLSTFVFAFSLMHL